MNAPYYASKYRDWRLRVDTHNQEIQDKLHPIPGLKIVHEESVVRGTIDAIGAACLVLGIDRPYAGPPKIQCLNAHKVPLKDYQIEGVLDLLNILRSSGGALLADDMGLGKTLQAIAVANQLPQPSRNLIIAPRFMSEGWGDELTKWGEPDYVMIRSGETKKHKQAWLTAQSAKWVVTSYEMMGKVVEQCFNSQAPDFLILDEAHMVKNVGAGRTKSAMEIATLTNFKLAITATPMWSRPKDFYGILKVLFGQRFGSRTAFYFRYCGGAINAHGGLDANGATNEEELKKRLAYYMVRREKKDVLKELPSLTRQVIWLDSDTEGEKAFKAAVLNKRANATYEACRATTVAKMEMACELAAQAKQFVLFTYERRHAEQLGKKLDLSGTPNVVIHGGIDVKKRHALIQQARTTGSGIVATIDSLGAGVNLQGVAHIGIMLALDWVPLKLAQAEARIHRLGQEMPVMWYYLACKDTIDEVIIKNIVAKLDQWRAIIGHDSNRSLRDDLGAGDGQTEEEALKAIYAAMD